MGVHDDLTTPEKSPCEAPLATQGVRSRPTCTARELPGSRMPVVVGRFLGRVIDIEIDLVVRFRQVIDLAGDKGFRLTGRAKQSGKAVFGIRGIGVGGQV